jgi:hypothetical protein
MFNIKEPQDFYDPDELHERMNEWMVGSAHSQKSSPGCFTCLFWVVVLVLIALYLLDKY